MAYAKTQQEAFRRVKVKRQLRSCGLRSPRDFKNDESLTTLRAKLKRCKGK